MSQFAFNWQMFLAFWGLVAFCALSFLVNCYLLVRNQKIFHQNKNIISQLTKISADMGNTVSGITIMGQRVLSLESNTVTAFHQFERRLKDQGVSANQAQTAQNPKNQSKAEASLLQLLQE